MKLGTKLARKVSLAVLLTLMNRENSKRDDLPTFPPPRTVNAEFIKPPEGG